MKQIFTLLIALCWLLPSAHADVRRAEVKDSLLRIYLPLQPIPPDETLYQIALLDQLSPTFIYTRTNYWKRPSLRKMYITRVAATIMRHYLLLQSTGPKRAEQWTEEARTVV